MSTITWFESTVGQPKRLKPIVQRAVPGAAPIVQQPGAAVKATVIPLLDDTDRTDVFAAVDGINLAYRGAVPKYSTSSALKGDWFITRPGPEYLPVMTEMIVPPIGLIGYFIPPGSPVGRVITLPYGVYILHRIGTGMASVLDVFTQEGLHQGRASTIRFMRKMPMRMGPGIPVRYTSGLTWLAAPPGALGVVPVVLDAWNFDTCEYTLQQGDILSELGPTYGVTVHDINMVNLSKPNTNPALVPYPGPGNGDPARYAWAAGTVINMPKTACSNALGKLSDQKTKCNANPNTEWNDTTRACGPRVGPPPPPPPPPPPTACPSGEEPDKTDPTKCVPIVKKPGVATAGMGGGGGFLILLAILAAGGLALAGGTAKGRQATGRGAVRAGAGLERAGRRIQARGRAFGARRRNAA